MSASVETISGWGRYPRRDCLIVRPGGPDQLARELPALPSAIVRGNGRSYGDASLNPDATIDAKRLDRLLDFDPQTGRLVCEAGVMLADIIDAMLPRGWFPPVTPGTKLVTIGGMIASDVHGKNHHGAGSFCDHLAWIDLASGDGRVVRCSRSVDPELFAATCGGMGLTGAILRASFQMIRVETAFVRQRTLRAATLKDAFDLFEQSLAATYSVAWIDCLATGEQLGRSIILLGEHAAIDELDEARRTAPLARVSSRSKRVPIDFPAFALGRGPVRLFNQFYYAAHPPGDRLIDLDRYFYPLDAIKDWNRIYGRRGFVQYQCVLPLAESFAGITRLLTLIAAAGQASFLSVLKRMGPESFGLLSFPREGYTLALDFPARPDTFALLVRLDAIVAEHGGRIYLAKDARAGADAIAAGYPRLDEFRQIRREYGLDRHFSSLLSRRLEI